ncbi:cell division protein FtsQ/DivIB [Algoriphagus sp. AK58]|uniref:cell division protein FtsQ/DivIB n=1 Tax=Algoriphagus sp. AK58 TaxID=1406877 RepID=UPI00164FBFDD|nr:cell division protein [Algoriphagus sp. AK58]MBC6368248.1 cell division protein [Algoriphagus sp. AK58]
MNKRKLKKALGLVTLSLVLVGFIGFVEKQVQLKTYQGLEIDLEAVSGVYFVEEKEIERIIASAFPELKAGLPLDEVPLAAIEERLLGHPFIKSAEASVGQKGIVKTSIKQHEPIARIARPDGADGYITKEGLIIPTSPTYTSRVLILEGEYAEQLMDQGSMDTMPELMPLIHFITQDEFWNAQVTELEINKKNDIRIHQQVGKQVIEFGDALDFESKFKRIEVLYKEILPRKGWNAYERISVKFKNQIVCE